MIAQNEIRPVTKSVVVLDDAAIGHQAFERRLQTLIDSRTFARMVGVSQTYLLSLEKGKSKWSAELIDRYNAALRDHG
jgi:hypothetical protein